MTASVYFTLLLVIVFFALGIFMSPLFIAPAILLLLFLLFTGPLLALMKASTERRATGTPSTEDASYEAVGETDRPAV
jgi:membrane protein implicated in regulation of membrane protease activity